MLSWCVVAGLDLTSGVPLADLPGQDRAVAALRAAAGHPVHAYLFVGPRGSGAEHAAVDFAAMLLCSHGGCGECTHCDRAMRRGHPDLFFAERSGVAYRVSEIVPRKDSSGPTVLELSVRRPLEANRVVVIVPDAHLLRGSAGDFAPAAAFLKTLEEPPESTVFILVAEELVPEMATINSRCVAVEFDPLSDAAIISWLEGHGISAERARQLAEGAAGDAQRALVLAQDEGFGERLARWQEVPTLLDGTGATATDLALRLVASLKEATAALEAVQAAELADLDAAAEAMGEKRAPGRSGLVDHHKREVRRYQDAELRAGLGVLARAYRDRLADALEAGDDRAVRSSAEAIDAIGAFAAELKRNPRMNLGLSSLLVGLSSPR